MEAKIFAVLLLFVGCSLGQENEAFVTVDHIRNLPGSGGNTVIGIPSQTNDIYFTVVGNAAQYSTYTFEDANSGLTAEDYQVTVKTIFANAETIVRLTFTPLPDVLVAEQGSEDPVIMLKLKVNDTGVYDLNFNFYSMMDATLINCLNDVVTVMAPIFRNDTYLAVLGYETVADCNFKINMDSSLSVNIPMSTCGIAWEEPFTLRFTRLDGFEGSQGDMQAQFTCKRLTSQFAVTNKDTVSRYSAVLDEDSLSFEHEVQVTMYLHERDDPSAVINTQGVVVKHPVSLTIEIDALYRNDFDVIPLTCSANNITILGTFDSLLSFGADKAPEDMPDVACATDPFSNFNRISAGNYRSDFTMFRTTRNGISDTYVNFECLLYVCRAGECPALNCLADL